MKLSPKTICHCLNFLSFIANLLKMKPSKIAKFISTGKTSIFDCSEVSPTQLTLKFLGLLQVCSRNILPTKNYSCLSSDMGQLIFAIEIHVLPYPALITKLLEVNKITAREDEVFVPLKRHTLGKSLRNMILCGLNCPKVWS